MKVADRHRPLFNVTISNVPGPPFPLFVAGAQVRSTYPIGPIFDGGGLNMTVMSYLDSLDFGLNACTELMPEIWKVADGLHLSLEELKKAAETHLTEHADVADQGDEGDAGDEVDASAEGAAEA
jgi:hypothetical protein